MRRRLFVDRLLRAICFDLIIFLGLFSVLLVLERTVSMGLETGLLLAASVFASILVSFFRTVVWGRVSVLDAARVADGRLALKERVSTAVYLQGAARSSVPSDKPYLDGWRELIWRDGLKQLEGVSLQKHFPVRPPRSVWAVVGAAAVGFLVFTFVPVVDVFGYGEERQALAEEKKEVERRTEELDKQLKELASEAETKKAPDVQELLRSLTRKKPEARKPASPSSPPALSNQSQARKEALVELTRKEDVLKKSLDSKKFKDLRKVLKRFQKTSLKNLQLTRKLRQALKDGDLKKTLKELSALQRRLEQLAKIPRDKLTPEQRKLMQELARELASLTRDSGSLGKLSSSLSSLASRMSAQDLQGALDSLELSREELERLAGQKDRTEMLRKALDLVRRTKQDLASLNQLAKNQKPHKCPNCGKPKGPPNPWQKPGGT